MLATTRSPEISARRRRRTRPWRIVFVAYALLLTIGTHWPSFVLAEEVPASDKALHMTAFGVLAWLLWRTGWIARRSVVCVIALAWSLLDESSQSIDVLNRWASWDDAVANALGVVLAAAGLWALRPIGGDVNRMRLRLHDVAFDELFLSPRTWLVFGLLALACVPPTVAAWRLLGPEATRRVIVVSALIAAVAASALLLRLWRGERGVVARQRRCFACGHGCEDAIFDERGEGRCPRCGSPLHIAQWSDPDPPPLAGLTRILGQPLLAAAIIALVALAIIALSPVLYSFILRQYPNSGLAPTVAHFVGTLPRDLGLAIDTTLLLLLFAAAVRMYRARLARFFDSPIRCRRCGHDLRGTPTHQGVGRCGECGTTFVRLDPFPGPSEHA